MNQKKALLVTRVSGFVPQHEMNNVKILQEMGYEVHYATNLNEVVYGKDNSRLENTGIITHQIDFERSPFSKNVKIAYKQLTKLMLTQDYDMVHCHMPMSGVVARLAAKDVQKRTGRKIPVLYTAHGFHFCSGEALKNWIYYPIERYLARYTDRLIVINQEDYKMAKKFPIRGTVEYVPGVGVNIGSKEDIVSNASKKDVLEVLHENGVKISERIAKKTPDTKILVAIGELNENKNHCLLLEMMSELKDLDLMCVICGTGNQMESLEQQIEERQLQDRVILAGYVNDVTQVLQSADCFVLPSKREGLPVVVMEAMAQGLPVIACEIRGVTDLIVHTKGGYLVKRNDAVDFAVKVRRLFTEKEGKSAVPRVIRRQQMGEWNKKRIQAFSKEVVEQRMREIYQSLE